MEISSKDHQIYLLKSLLWLGLAWGGFLFTLVGFFHAWLIWAMFLLTAGWLTRKMLKNNFSLRPSKEIVLASLIFLLAVVFFSLFSTPTVFTGRDQGSFSEGAVRLSQNHKLEFSTPTSQEFFKLHESGRALNFPGFYYTKSGNLITQFSLMYISWLALFFSVFGVTGFVIANAILLYIFFLSFYLLIRMFVGTWAALPTTLFALTSFVFMWFSKMTLSENMAIALLWTSIVALMLMLKNQKKLPYLMFLVSSILLCFARIEGLAFLLASAIIIAANKNSRQYVKENISSRFFLPLTIFLIVLGFNIFNDVYFYKEIIKALLPTIALPKATYLTEIKNNVLPSFYIEKIFYLYGLLGFFVVGTFALAAKFWKKEFYSLVPFFVTLPTFVYFVDDHISADHPWLLRRFVFSLAPVMIFYSGLMLGQWFEKKQAKKTKVLAALITIILLAGNMPAMLKYVTFSENKNLLAQTKTLGEQFSDNDLILIDQNATGDGWSMISGPLNYLYGKNAVYFFNVQDLAKLDTQRFDKIFLIAPNSQVSYYLNSAIGPRLSEKNNYALDVSRIDVQKEGPDKPLTLPDKTETLIQGKIFEISK
ncbi:MAG: hypothetical protein PHW24_00010 [Candidatus Moranbacteria bacterium]|nr:hypothetical protein [Candidatus Moranbacteria bacterium]